MGEQLSLETLQFDEGNANRGCEDGAVLLQGSLQNYGAGRSVLIDREGRIIAGNKTVEAAIKVGIKGIIMVDSEGDKLVVVRRNDLNLATDQRARELATLDNRSSEVNLVWDHKALIVHEPEKLLQLGFQAEDVDRINKGRQQLVIDGEEVGPETAQAEAVPVEGKPSIRMVQVFLDTTTFPIFEDAIKKLGQLWELATVTDVVYRAVCEAAYPAKKG
jgi:hypothetical protein